MPNLPNHKKEQETKFSKKFREWIEKNPRMTTSCELKDTRGKSCLLLSEIKQKQIDFGMKIKSDEGVLVRVLPVLGGEPDYIWVRNQPAYVWIKYPTFFCAIDIELIAKEKKKTNRLTEKRAKDIAIIVV